MWQPRQVAQALRAPQQQLQVSPVSRPAVVQSVQQQSSAPAMDQKTINNLGKAAGEWFASPSETADDFTGPPQDTWGNAYKIGASGDGGMMGGMGGLWDKFSNTGGFSSGGGGGGGMGSWLGYANMAKDGYNIFDNIKNTEQGVEGRDKGSVGGSLASAGQGAMGGFQAGGPLGALIGAGLGNESYQWEHGNRDMMKDPGKLLESELTGGLAARDMENWFGLKLNPKDWF